MTTPDLRRSTALGRLSKVPEATAAFWVIKILTTGTGETASDFIGNSAIPVAAALVVVTVVALVTALYLQFTQERYVAPVYWAAIAMISVVGTMLSDGSRIALGISFLTSTLSFVVALTVVFALWYRSERTLSIHSITTRRREVFYWCAVVATFALGTSAGDWTAVSLNLGFLGSGLMFIGIILVPFLAHRFLGLNAIVAFWVIKILTTGTGETASDFIGNSAIPVAAALVVVTVVALVTALYLQFTQERYVAPVYWAAIAMISVVGTMLSDGSRIALGISFLTSTLSFVVALTVVFALWYRSERTLSIHSITTRRREVFYWCAVVATFALGTSAGDWTAVSLNLGFLGSGLMFIGIILVPFLAHRFLGLNAIVAFWAAYITTRPLGASFADWMAVEKSRGGLGFGTGPVTLVFSLVILAFVAWISWRGRDLVESLDVENEA